MPPYMHAHGPIADGKSVGAHHAEVLLQEILHRIDGSEYPHEGHDPESDNADGEP